MPRFMPNERQADCSSRGRTDSTGPTSQAAANSSAVLARITARYSSSVVAVFLAAASCITSPSAMMAAAAERISSARSEPTSTIILNAWPSRKSPTSTLASLPHSMRAASRAAAHLALVDDVVVQQRRGVHELDRGGELDVAVAAIAGEPRHREREHRPQPLAAGIDQVVGDLRDHRHFGSGPRQDRAVDAFHVGCDQVDQGVDRGWVPAFEGDDDGHKVSPLRDARA